MLKKVLIATALATAPLFTPLFAEEEPTFDIAQMQIDEAPAGIDFSAELRRITTTLGGIILLGAITLLALRRFTNRRQVRFNNSSKIQVLEQRALSQKSAAYLLEVAGKQIFFAESPHGVTAITLEPERASRDFHELLEEGSKN